MKTGTMTLARICANKWPRLMCITWAAAYVGMSANEFEQVPELMALVHNINGKNKVDRDELDLWVNNINNTEGK